MSSKYILICLTFLALAVPSGLEIALARQPLPDLEVGMSYSEVVALYGAADEKTERETKREELWHYSHTEALFRDGRVVQWHRLGQETQPALAMTVAPAPLPSHKTQRISRERDKKIPLTDILNEVEQSNSTDSPGSGPTRGGPQNALRRLQPPPDFASQVQRMAERRNEGDE